MSEITRKRFEEKKEKITPEEIVLQRKIAMKLPKIERKAEEARREERKAKREYERIFKSTLNKIKQQLDDAAKLELATAIRYRKWSEKYARFPTLQRILRDLADEHDEIARKIHKRVFEVESEFEKRYR